MAAARRVLREGPLPPAKTVQLEALLSGLVAPSTESSVSALGGARASIDLHPGVNRRPGVAHGEGVGGFDLAWPLSRVHRPVSARPV